MTNRLKAIIRYNVKEVLAIIIIFAIFNGIAGLLMNYYVRNAILNSSNEHYTFFTGSIADSMKIVCILFMVIMLLLVTVQYSDIKTPGTYCFTTSLPVKKGTWLISKLAVGVVMLLCSFIFIAVLSTVFYYSYYDEFSRQNISSVYYTQLCRADSLGNELLYILYIYLLLTAFYMFLMLCQSITGNIAAGFFIAAAIIIAPRYLMGTANNIMLIFENKELPHYNILHSISLDYLITDVDMIVADERTTAVNLSFVPIRLVALPVVNVFLVISNYFIYNKTDYSSQRLFLHKPVEKIAVIFAGVFVAFITPQISETKQHGMSFLIILMSVVAVVTIFILWRYLRTDSRYDNLNSWKERQNEKI